jgi:tRNA dimethylallyltransferase
MPQRATALLIAGPTAAGKSAIALEVAERYGAILVSADAMQVYRGMDIGTATPAPDELARVPHVGVNIVEPDEAFSAGDFVALADEAFASGQPVIVAGGTALYMRALVRGLVHTPPVDPILRARLQQTPDLHAELSKVDPELANRLHPNDRLRLVRGLEVWTQTGTRLSELQAEHAKAPDRVRTLGVWLDRDDLYQRIDARVLQMMRDGYLDEVRALLDAGVPRDCRPMRSLGYRHLASHLLDDLDLDEAIRLTQRDTRHFARKQRTWHKHLGVPDAPSDHRSAVLRAAAALFEAHIPR